MKINLMDATITREPLDLQQHIFCRWINLRKGVFQLPPQHCLHDSVYTALCGLVSIDQFSVSQYGDLFTSIENFIQSMGNKDNAHTLFAELFNNCKQFFSLSKTQWCRRFIQQ